MQKRYFYVKHYADRTARRETEETIFQWAVDDAEKYGYAIPETIEAAIDILHCEGDLEIREFFYE